MWVGTHWQTRDHIIPHGLFWAMYKQIPAMQAKRNLDEFHVMTMSASVAQAGDPKGYAARTERAWRRLAYPEEIVT